MATKPNQKTLTQKLDLRAELNTIGARYYHGGDHNHAAMERNLKQAQVARKALAALAAKVERLEADAKAHPTAWYDDAAHLAGQLIDLL